MRVRHDDSDWDYRAGAKARIAAVCWLTATTAIRSALPSSGYGDFARLAGLMTGRYAARKGSVGLSELLHKEGPGVLVARNSRRGPSSGGVWLARLSQSANLE